MQQGLDLIILCPLWDTQYVIPLFHLIIFIPRALGAAFSTVWSVKPAALDGDSELLLEHHISVSPLWCLRGMQCFGAQPSVWHLCGKRTRWRLWLSQQCHSAPTLPGTYLQLSWAQTGDFSCWTLDALSLSLHVYGENEGGKTICFMTDGPFGQLAP